MIIGVHMCVDAPILFGTTGFWYVFIAEILYRVYGRMWYVNASASVKEMNKTNIYHLVRVYVNPLLVLLISVAKNGREKIFDRGLDRRTAVYTAKTTVY